MNAQKALSAELLAALGIATIGAGGKAPPPHRYTGVFLLFFVLGLMADATTEMARVATALGGLVVLTMAMGTAGARFLGWSSNLGSRLGVVPAPPAVPTPPAGGKIPRPAPSGRSRIKVR